MGGNCDQAITPTLASPRWLAATMETGYDCGGAHPLGKYEALDFPYAPGH